jgi:tetratricopeptide (TPR) repeat protein
MAEPEEQEKEQDLDVWIKMQAWAETRRKQIGIGVVVALVAGFALYTNSHLQALHFNEAESALIALAQLPAAGGEPKPVAASEYLKVSDEYAGTPASERALLLAAASLFTENKYDAAEKRFSEFLGAYPASGHINQARLGVAASQDAQNRYEEALASYQRLIASAAGSSEANQAKIASALIHEQQGKPEQALKLYDELIRVEPQLVWNGEASLRRDELLKRHPQLTPAPDAAATLPAMPTPLIVPDASTDPSQSLVATNGSLTNALKAIIGTNTAPASKK